MGKTDEVKTAKTELKAEMEAEAKVKAEAKAKAEAEVAAIKKAEEEEAKKTEEIANAAMSEEAKNLGVTASKVKMTGFKDKKPDKVEKEEAKHKRLVIDRVKRRIAKKKAEAKMKPIDKRRALLISRLRAVKSRTRSHTYSDANIRAWVEELEMINRNPKSWNEITANGTKNYTPSNKRKKTARDILDGMDLE